MLVWVNKGKACRVGAELERSASSYSSRPMYLETRLWTLNLKCCIYTYVVSCFAFSQGCPAHLPGLIRSFQKQHEIQSPAPNNSRTEWRLFGVCWATDVRTEWRSVGAVACIGGQRRASAAPRGSRPSPAAVVTGTRGQRARTGAGRHRPRGRARGPRRRRGAHIPRRLGRPPQRRPRRPAPPPTPPPDRRPWRVGRGCGGTRRGAGTRPPAADPTAARAPGRWPTRTPPPCRQRRAATPAGHASDGGAGLPRARARGAAARSTASPRASRRPPAAAGGAAGERPVGRGGEPHCGGCRAGGGDGARCRGAAAGGDRVGGRGGVGGGRRGGSGPLGDRGGGSGEGRSGAAGGTPKGLFHALRRMRKWFSLLF